ncbi:hypothetical protein Aperf_G00000015909 [Anoplocephala perfoliata]
MVPNSSYFTYMALRQRRPPIRRLFRDSSNILENPESPVDEILGNICRLQISEFRKKYQFDLNTMQPCSSETDLRKDGYERRFRHCWSWEAVNAESVPAFYRPCVARSRKAAMNPSSSLMPDPETSVKPKKKSQNSPTMNTIFRTIKRSSSLGNHVERTEYPKSRSQSLIQEKKVMSDPHPTFSLKRDHHPEVIP